VASPLLRALAYTRAPGNALSFWLRRHWQWSRGLPELPHEGKEGLWAHLRLRLSPREQISWEHLAGDLAKTYRLDALQAHSTQALYRKSLYLLHGWESITRAVPGTQALFPADPDEPLRALDVGPQDWHYVFALERWLRHHGTDAAQPGRPVSLHGVEVDGFERYRDWYTRRDYARAYARQTGNTDVTYHVEDLRQFNAEPFHWITWFFPLVSRYETLLWGLPARYANPQAMAAKLARLARPQGWLLLMTHTQREHDLAHAALHATGSWVCHEQAPACNPLVDFYERIQDRRISLWQRRGE
jgi:hypothetical protein